KQSLERALRDDHLLDIGETHCRLRNLPDAVTQAQAAISDHVPAHFIVEPHDRVGDWKLNEIDQETEEFQSDDDGEHSGGEKQRYLNKGLFEAIPALVVSVFFDGLAVWADDRFG